MPNDELGPGVYCCTFTSHTKKIETFRILASIMWIFFRIRIFLEPKAPQRYELIPSACDMRWHVKTSSYATWNGVSATVVTYLHPALTQSFANPLELMSARGGASIGILCKSFGTEATCETLVSHTVTAFRWCHLKSSGLHSQNSVLLRQFSFISFITSKAIMDHGPLICFWDFTLIPVLVPGETLGGCLLRHGFITWFHRKLKAPIKTQSCELRPELDGDWCVKCLKILPGAWVIWSYYIADCSSSSIGRINTSTTPTWQLKVFSLKRRLDSWFPELLSLATLSQSQDSGARVPFSWDGSNDQHPDVRELPFQLKNPGRDTWGFGLGVPNTKWS